MQLAGKHPLYTCRPKHGIRGAGEPRTIIFYIRPFIIRFIAEAFSIRNPVNRKVQEGNLYGVSPFVYQRGLLFEL